MTLFLLIRRVRKEFIMSNTLSKTATVKVNTKFRMFFTESSLKKAIETVYAEDQKQMFQDLLSILSTKNTDDLNSVLDRSHSNNHRDNRYYFNHFIEYFIFNKSIFDEDYNYGFKINLSSIKLDKDLGNNDCLIVSFSINKTFDNVEEYVDRSDLISTVISSDDDDMFDKALMLFDSMIFNAKTRSDAELCIDDTYIIDVITKTFVTVKSAIVSCMLYVRDVVVAVEDPNSLSNIKDEFDTTLNKLIHHDQVDFMKYYAEIESIDTYDTDLDKDDIEFVYQNTDEAVS